ncbi:MAG TPA: Ppx/GppA phosphatase family protein [Thermoplasmata archaeon]|nr:Ppx/GppA phosphatase family protein [Thermoplasmata archaeon]
MLSPLDPPADPPPSHVVAFMDIGSNSVRLLLVRINPNQTYTVLTEQKEVVRLGETVFVDGRLHPTAIRRTANACQDFVSLARARGATEIIAVATSATREAKNQAEFLRTLKRQVGLDVRVISGKEEARLIYLGTSHVARKEDGQALFIDIGGGSTELAIGDQKQYAYLDSLRLGAIRLSEMFHLDADGPISKKHYDRVCDYVRDTAAPTFKRIQRFRIGQFIGSSGTIENLADILYRVRYDRRRDRSDVMRHSELAKIIDLLFSLSLDDRRAVPGINPERADIIVGGAAIVDVFMDELDLPEIHPTDRGMRDGLLLDYLANSEHADFYGGVPIRDRSVLQLARACGSDEAHTRVVARLATELFDSARKLDVHRYGAEERDLLAFAAFLHDVGAFLSYDNQNEHAWYLISSADLLGFNRTEIGIIAALAFFSRKGFPKRGHPKLEGLDPSSQNVVRTLTAFLRIADGLDRSRRGLVEHARLLKGRDGLVLHIKARGDATTDRWGVQYNNPAIEKLLGRRVIME